MPKPKPDAPTHVVVKVFLYGIQPTIWRRLRVPLEIDFATLHDHLQDAMGWNNKRPHEFRHGKGKRLVDVIGPVGLADQTPGEFRDELSLTIAAYLGRKALPMRMLYRYDFADEWIHEVVFEQRVIATGGPALLEGARACPPEDFGGSFAYMQALHGDLEWDDRKYDPEAFNPATVVFGARRKR
jgi:hypothetical protein